MTRLALIYHAIGKCHDALRSNEISVEQMDLVINLLRKSHTGNAALMERKAALIHMYMASPDLSSFAYAGYECYKLVNICSCSQGGMALASHYVEKVYDMVNQWEYEKIRCDGTDGSFEIIISVSKIMREWEDKIKNIKWLISDIACAAKIYNDAVRSHIQYFRISSSKEHMRCADVIEGIDIYIDRIREAALCCLDTPAHGFIIRVMADVVSDMILATCNKFSQIHILRTHLITVREYMCSR